MSTKTKAPAAMLASVAIAAAGAPTASVLADHCDPGRLAAVCVDPVPEPRHVESRQVERQTERPADSAQVFGVTASGNMVEAPDVVRAMAA